MKHRKPRTLVLEPLMLVAWLLVLIGWAVAFSVGLSLIS